MFFVADHGEHEGHRVIDAIGACGDFVDAEAIIEGAGEFGTELKAIVGK